MDNNLSASKTWLVVDKARSGAVYICISMLDCNRRLSLRQTP